VNFVGLRVSAVSSETNNNHFEINKESKKIVLLLELFSFKPAEEHLGLTLAHKVTLFGRELEDD
jgi:hypothetical protein